MPIHRMLRAGGAPFDPDSVLARPSTPRTTSDTQFRSRRDEPLVVAACPEPAEGHSLPVLQTVRCLSSTCRPEHRTAPERSPHECDPVLGRKSSPITVLFSLNLRLHRIPRLLKFVTGFVLANPERRIWTGTKRRQATRRAHFHKVVPLQSRRDSVSLIRNVRACLLRARSE
jgi:hypothetical protein